MSEGRTGAFERDGSVGEVFFSRLVREMATPRRTGIVFQAVLGNAAARSETIRRSGGAPGAGTDGVLELLAGHRGSGVSARRFWVR